MSNSLTYAPCSNPFAALWHDLVGSWRRARAAARHEPIDDATLRDLGLSRSELASVLEEAEGRVAATRLRVIRARGVSSY